MRAILLTVLLTLLSALPLMAGTSVYGTWTLDQSPVILVDNSFVPLGESLTIEAGVEVYFLDGLRLQVFGQINVYGSAENPVIFGVMNQGDTWEGISIIGPGEGLTNTFQHTQILDTRIGLAASESILDFEYCIVKSSYYALLLENESLAHVYNSLLGVTSLVSEAKAVYVLNSYLDVQETDISLEIPFYTDSAAGGALHFFLSGGVVESCHVSSISRTGADGIRLQNCLNSVSISRTSIHVSRSGGLADRRSAGIYASQSDLMPLDRVSIHTDIDAGVVYGLYVTQGADVDVVNSIFSSTSPIPGTIRYAAYIDPHSNNSSIDFAYVCVDEMNIANDTPYFGMEEETMVLSNPRWVAPDQQDYHLLPDSPCIDAGSPFTEQDYDGSLPDLGAFVFIGTHVQGEIPELATAFDLTPAWPNPFNASTQFSVHLASSTHVSAQVQNILGRTVSVLTDRMYPAGVHRISWHSSLTTDLASGVYLLQVVAGDQVATQRLVLLK